mgnify:CR=1 FL=1
MAVNNQTVSYSVSNSVQYLQNVATTLSSLGVSASVSGTNLVVSGMGGFTIKGDSASLNITFPNGEVNSVLSNGSFTVLVRKDGSGTPTAMSITNSAGYSVLIAKAGIQYFMITPSLAVMDNSLNTWYPFTLPSVFQNPDFTIGGQIYLLPFVVFRGTSGMVIADIYLSTKFISNIGATINATAQLCSISGTFYAIGRFSYAPSITTTMVVRDA